MRVFHKIGILLVLSVLMSACAGPQAKYKMITSNNQQDIKDGGYKFSLQASKIILQLDKEKKLSSTNPEEQIAAVSKITNKQTITESEDLDSIQAIVSPSENKEVLYVLYPYEEPWYLPNFSVTYYPTTFLVNALGTNAKDN